MADFNLAYAPVAKWEGGWTHDSGDKGGETFRGCAPQLLPQRTDSGPSSNREKSHPSYKKGKAAFSAHLWGFRASRVRQGLVQRKSGGQARARTVRPDRGDELFEQAVNLGKAGMGRYLQRLCNAFNWRKDGSADGARCSTISRRTASSARRRFRPFPSSFPGTTPGASMHLMNCIGRALRNSGANRFPLRKFCVGGWPTRTYDPGQEVFLMDFATLMDSQSGIVALGMAAVPAFARSSARSCPRPRNSRHVVPDCLRAAELDRLQQGQSQNADDAGNGGK